MRKSPLNIIGILVLLSIGYSWARDVQAEARNEEDDDYTDYWYSAGDQGNEGEDEYGYYPWKPQEKVIEQRGESFWRSECRVWSSEETYLAGDKVKHGEKFYEAKWWTSNNEPGNEWGAWTIVGDKCEGNDLEPEVDPVEAEIYDEDDVIIDESENEIDDSNTIHESPHDGPPTRAKAEKREHELTDTPIFDMVKQSISTIESSKVDEITVGNGNNPVNVKRVEKIMTEEQYGYLFPVRDPAYTYRRFLQAIGKFPAVCDDYSDGRDADAICRRALATMFAHFTQETGGHNPNGDVEGWRQGLVYLREAGCSETGGGCGYDSACDLSTWQGRTWPCGEDGGKWKKYYGRGAKQLSYNFNYGPFSDAMFGTVHKLLKNPDLVASTWLNLASATWFYTYPQPPKPSMLHVIDGTWVPNEEDKKNKLEPGFGATIMIINGGIECGHGSEKPQAINRQEYYKKFAEYFKVDISGEEISCAHMKSFNKGGAGSLYIYWDREWVKQYECQLVKYQTPFNALKPGDYVRCVEDQFKVKLE